MRRFFIDILRRGILAESGRRSRIVGTLLHIPLQLEDLRLEHQINFFMGSDCHIEHSIRFQKGELGLTAGQFNSTEAEGRVQVWVEMVATAFWFLWALCGFAKEENKPEHKALIPKWWKSRKMTPGAIRKMAAGLLLSLGWKKPVPKPRGKSRGWATGVKMEPRKTFNAARTASL